MNKKRISLISGLIIGLIISSLTLEYNGWTIVHVDSDGSKRIINELDFNLLTNVLSITLGTIIIIYFLLTVIEKKFRGRKHQDKQL